MSNDKIEVTILKWREFNPKSDFIRHPQWFRINNDISTSATLFGLTHEQKWIWICLLSICSKKNSESISITVGHFARVCESKKDTVLQTIEILRDNSALSFTDSKLTGNRHKTDDTLHYIQTDIHTSSADDPHPLIRIWNEHCKNLPKVKICGKERSRLIKTEWAKNSDPRYWIEIIKKIASDPWCLGKVGNKGHEKWRADFDFMLREKTQIRVIEGSIGGKSNGAAGDICAVEEPWGENVHEGQ